MTFDRKSLAGTADGLAAAVAVSLPWSTSATSILLILWLIAVLASMDVAAVRREIGTAAGGLPVLLWLLAAVGMLWADVGWPERLNGLGGFHRLLAVPLLLAQFRRSTNGAWVVNGFFAAAVVLLLASWASAIDPAIRWPWPHVNPIRGVPVKDVISQSTIFFVCTFALIWRALDRLRERRWLAASLSVALACLFVANLIFVDVSRGDIVVAPVLLVLLGWRQARWRGVAIACLVGCGLAVGAWTGSSYLRGRLVTAVQNVEAYQSRGTSNDVGDHLEFLRKSLEFVRQAPVIGHGTGTIADLFRRAAANATGSAAVATVNPHNQIFAVAIQLGVAGAALLLAMWAAHYLLFASSGFAAWIGAVIVIENFVTSLTSSHLFDFMHGWLYVFGVGVIGGMMLRRRSEAKPEADAHPGRPPLEQAPNR